MQADRSTQVSVSRLRPGAFSFPGCALPFLSLSGCFVLPLLLQRQRRFAVTFSETFFQVSVALSVSVSFRLYCNGVSVLPSLPYNFFCRVVRCVVGLRCPSVCRVAVSVGLFGLAGVSVSRGVLFLSPATCMQWGFPFAVTCGKEFSKKYPPPTTGRGLYLLSGLSYQCCK